MYLFFVLLADVIGSFYPDKGNIVNRTACKARYTGNCCADSIDIRIKVVDVIMFII